jgi:hypothetical protein
MRSFKPYFLLALVAGLAIGKVILTEENSYEGKFFAELIHSPSVIMTLPKTYAAQFFISRIPRLYLWLILIEGILLIYFLSKKTYLKLIWHLATAGFFILVTLLTYNKGDSDMMMERAFMPLALFVSLPFLKEIFENHHKFRILKFLFLTLIILVSLNRIFSQGKVFWERTRFNQELLVKTSRYPNRKFIIESSELQKHQMTYWSYSFETLLLSTVTANTPTQTIFPASNAETLIKYTRDPGDVFLGTDFWLEWGIQSLNMKYFQLPTDLPYLIVKIDEPGPS